MELKDISSDRSKQAQGAQPECHQDKGHGGIGHILMMAICCLVPLGAILIMNKLGYSNEAGYLILLLCPLMHIFMMRGMFNKQQSEK